jgi:acyl-CoA thioesterase-2
VPDAVSADLTLLAPVRTADGRFAEGEQRFRDGLPRMYGGHVLAHAVWSALMTTDPDRVLPHSVHAHFVDAARPEELLVAGVDQVRDGRSFALRTAAVEQAGRLVMLASISSHVAEVGDTWPEPERDPGSPPRWSNPDVATPLAGFDVRTTTGVSEMGWPRHPLWIKAAAPLPDDPRLHVALLAYVSDAGLVGASRGAGTRELTSYRLASLDHALWIHRRHRMDDWLRFDAHPVVNVGARGLIRGSFTDRRGRMVATVMQETLIRPPATTDQRQRWG